MRVVVVDVVTRILSCGRVRCLLMWLIWGYCSHLRVVLGVWNKITRRGRVLVGIIIGEGTVVHGSRESDGRLRRRSSARRRRVVWFLFNGVMYGTSALRMKTSAQETKCTISDYTDGFTETLTRAWSKLASPAILRVSHT